MAGRLPKVTEYIKNMGKSVAYATVETVTEPTETAREFMDTNEELFKTIYSAAKNYRQTLKLIDKTFKRSKIYEAGNLGFQALKEDLSTGKFFNKEREAQLGMEGVMGDDFADFSEFESDDFGDAWGDEDEGDEGSSEGASESTRVTIASTKTISGMINASSQAESKVIVGSAKALADVNMASTKLLYMQNEKLNATLTTGFSGMHGTLAGITSVLTGPLTTYMNESTKFYGDISNRINETNAYLKELSEMQRNLYKVRQEEYKTSRYDEVVGASGAPDITAYAKSIYKNIMNMDPTGGMLSGSSSDGNMFKVFVGSPLKFIPMAIAKMVIPTVVTDTLKAFDENMSGIFSSFVARMNSWAESDDFSGIGINFKGIIGNLLGIKNDRKSSVDVSKYQRGPMPFDGETKKAITDVIPQYLARIESAVSGRPTQYFDSASGKFKTLREIHKEYKSNQESAWAQSVSSIEDSFNKWANMTAKDYEERKKLQEMFKKLGKEVYNNGGDFTPYMGFGPRGERRDEQNPYFTTFGEDYWRSFANYLRDHDKKGVYQIAGNTFSATQSRNRYLKDMEGSFGNPASLLFNGSMLEFDNHGKLRRFDPNKGGPGEYYKAPDAYKSSTNYLRDILAEVRYIRRHGLKNKSGASSSNQNSTPNDDFDTYYKNEFAEDETREDPWVDPNATHTFTREQAPKEKTNAEKLGLTRQGVRQEFEAAEEVANNWESMKEKVDRWLKSPALWITNIIQKADQRIYDTMFGTEDGETFRDKAGRPYRSYLDYLVSRTEDIFDTMYKKIKAGFQNLWERFKKTKVGGWISEKGSEFAGNVGKELRAKLGWAKTRGMSALDNTYGTMFESMKAGKILSADDVKRMRQQRRDNDAAWDLQTMLYNGEDTSSYQENLSRDEQDELYDFNNIVGNEARGGRVTKYGLAMLSPGEIVIPNKGKGRQRNNLRNENREKSRIMQALKGGKIGNYANGTPNQNQGGGSIKDSKEWKAVKKVMGEISGEGAGIAANALIGSGVSLITGLFGGPLLGAAAGAGIGIVKKSETVQKFLFGDIDEETQERKGNIVPKSVIDFFNKNSKGMIDFGVAGAVAGLFTPLGLVGGALAGATLGWAKNTEGFQEFMFGSVEKGTTGLMSQETKEKIEKALPKMGIGMGASILLGPFGLVGNAMLGAAGGYVASTDKFKELIFGKEGEDGKKHGGMLGALKDGFINPLLTTGKKIATDLKDYAQKYIIDPTKSFLKGSGQFIRNTILSIGDRIADGVNGVFAKHLGIPLEEWFREKVFKRASSLIGGVTKAILAPAKFAVSLPFRTLGAIGNSMQARQIARGTMDTKNAKERLAFRDKNKFRFGYLRGSGQDKTLQLDKMLASADLGQLEGLTSNMDALIKNRGKKNIAFNKLIDSTGASVSDLFDEKGVWARRGHKIIGGTAIKDKKKIMEAIREGDFDEVRSILYRDGLSNEEVETFLQNIDMNKIMTARKEMIDETGLDEKTIKELEKATGFKMLHKGGNRWMKQMRRLMGTELKARKAEEANKTPEQKLMEEQKDNTKTIIDLLREINQSVIRAGNTYVGADGSRLTVNEKGDIGDGQSDVEASRKAKKQQEQDEENSKNLSKIGGFFSKIFGKKKDEENEDKPSLISRLLGFGKSVGGSLLGGIGTGLGVVGKVAKVALGVSALGYVSQFAKTKVVPWVTDTLLPKIAESPIFNGIKNFFKSIADGTLLQKIGSKITQGVTYALDNVIVPNIKGLTEKFVQGTVYALNNVGVPLITALAKALPKIGAGIVSGLLSGIGDAIKGLFKPKTQTTDTDISKDFNSTIRTLPTSSEDSNFDKLFSGKTNATKANYSFGNVTSLTSNLNTATNTTTSSGGYGKHKVSNVNTYTAPGTYENENGTTSVVDENGEVTVYDENGTALGSYDNETGTITSTHSVVEKENSVANILKNGLVRGLATGKTSNLTGIVANTGKFISNTLGKTSVLAKWGGRAVQGLGTLANAANVTGAAINQGTKAAASGASLANTLSKTGSRLATTGVFKADMAGASVVDKVSGALDKKFGTFFEWLAKSKFMTKFSSAIGKVGTAASKCTSSLTKVFPSLGSAIGKLASSSNIMAKAGSKVLGALGKMSPIGLVFWLYSFEEGMRKCETILGVAKDADFTISTPARVITGLVKAINDNLLFGIIPIDKVMDTVIEYIGDIVGIDKEELEAAQQETEELLTKSSIENGEEVTLGMYNNQQGLFKSIKNYITGQSNKYRVDTEATTTTTSTNTNNSYSGRDGGRSSNRGRGRGGFQGGIYAGMKYGNSTIGQAGCAPVAASMLMNGNVPEAANFAQNTGHVSADGSTDIGFFGDYFSAKGISSQTTTNKNSVQNALKSGHKAVLLGRDPNGGANSAYSDSSHFITAQGMDKKGNIIIDDPELGRRKMRSNSVFKNMKASVITGKGRYSMYRGRGDDDEVAGWDINSFNNDGSSNNAEIIVQIARNQVGITANSNNECKFNRDYRSITGGGSLTDPWCCKFVWWVFYMAGASSLFYGGKPQASCTNLMNFYKGKNRMTAVSNVQAGDIVFMNFSHDNPNKAEHVGIATGPRGSDGKVPTVEGNTTKPGSTGNQANGHGVWEKNRSEKDIVGIARPEYAGATLVPLIGTYSGFDTSGEDTSEVTLFGALKELGANMMKKMFGENAYNALYGSNTDESSDYSVDGTVASNADNNGNLTGNDNAEKIWTYLRSLGYSKAGTAGIMGSLEKESGLMPNNLQNTYNTSLGKTDAEYTTQVNNKRYSRDSFMNDKGGYGLAQWTYSTRKAGLYDKTVANGTPIDDMKSQLDYLDQEVGSYGLTDKIKNATDVSKANDIWISQFEKPDGYENKNSTTYTGRLAAAQKYYDQFKGTARSTNSFVNNYPTNSINTSTGTSGNLNYTEALQVIVKALLSIVENTEAIDQIYKLLAENGISVSGSQVTTETTSEDEAKKSINRLMNSRTDAGKVSNILQTKDTSYLVEIMAKLASE